jgi:hypothetical protein
MRKADIDARRGAAGCCPSRFALAILSTIGVNARAVTMQF